MIAIDLNGAKNCPHCATPLAEIPAPLSTTPAAHTTSQSPADLQDGAILQDGTHDAQSDPLFPALNENFFSLEKALNDTSITYNDAASQTNSTKHDLHSSTSFGNKEAETAHASDHDMTHDGIFGQILDATIHDTATGETMHFQDRADSSVWQQAQSCELLDKVFDKIQLDDQCARAPGSKSLAITALLGALILLSAIGSGIYYLKHTTAQEAALQTPANVLILPSPEAPAPTLKTPPPAEQQNEEGATYTAQVGSQARQDISAYQTPVPDEARHTSDSPEAQDVHGIPSKQAEEAGTPVPQKNMPSSGEAPSVTATSLRPRENNKDASVTIATAQSSSLSSAAKVLTDSENGSHILMCGSFQNKDKALKQAAKIRAKGYKPFVETADLGSKGIWYRIKIAGFNSKDAAEKARGELNRALKLAAIVAKRK